MFNIDKQNVGTVIHINILKEFIFPNRGELGVMNETALEETLS